MKKHSNNFNVIILGSGTSTGVPVIGCNCEVCTSTLPHYKRLRASIAIRDSIGRIILVDAGPDLRQQMLNHKITYLKNVLLTHTHADHCHGFDDLRAFCFKDKDPIQVFGDKEHLDDFKRRFSYMFDKNEYEGTIPNVTLKSIEPAQAFRVLDFTVESLNLEHGHTYTSAFKIGSFAYATDFKKFSSEQIQKWSGKIHTMVASGIRFRPHPSHSSIQEMIDLFSQLGVKRGIITHLSHEVAADEDKQKLPDWVSFAFDGMQLEVDHQ